MDARALSGSDLVVRLLDRCRFPDRDEVECAVSGGADSLALLVLAVAAGHRVTAVHVDHGLRPGSSAEADLVASVAESLGAGFRAEAVVIRLGPNLEARARAARYSVLSADSLIAHTADDQAETMLANLMRGAGLDGLAAMVGDPRRPLLGLRRSETRRLCDELGLEPLEDPMNVDPRFTRARVRGELLPLLADISGRDPVPVLVRQAGLLADTAEHLEAEAAQLDPTEARVLAAAPRALARTAVRAWLRTTNGACHPPDAAAVERVLAVARNEIRATELAGGWRVVRSGGRLGLVAPSS